MNTVREETMMNDLRVKVLTEGFMGIEFTDIKVDGKPLVVFENTDILRNNQMVCSPCSADWLLKHLDKIELLEFQLTEKDKLIAELTEQKHTQKLNLSDQIAEKDQEITQLKNQVSQLKEMNKGQYERIGELEECNKTMSEKQNDIDLLHKTILRMAKGIEFYGNSKNWNSQQIISVDIESVAPCDFYYIGGKLAREIQKETAEIVNRLRGGE